MGEAELASLIIVIYQGMKKIEQCSPGAIEKNVQVLLGEASQLGRRYKMVPEI